MKIIDFIIKLGLLYFGIYFILITLGLYALLMSYYTGPDFLNLLMLVGSFVSVFFSTLINFTQQTKTSDLEQVKHKFGRIFTSTSFLIVTILGFALILGVGLDILNIGFKTKIEFDFYYLIVQCSLGIYTGNLTTTIFKYIDTVKFVQYRENLDHII